MRMLAGVYTISAFAGAASAIMLTPAAPAVAAYTASRFSIQLSRMLPRFFRFPELFPESCIVETSGAVCQALDVRRNSFQRLSWRLFPLRMRLDLNRVTLESRN